MGGGYQLKFPAGAEANGTAELQQRAKIHYRTGRGSYSKRTTEFWRK